MVTVIARFVSNAKDAGRRVADITCPNLKTGQLTDSLNFGFAACSIKRASRPPGARNSNSIACEGGENAVAALAGRCERSLNCRD
jgi:hypothetical protein